MKIEKSNNPAAIGALVLVLVLIVGRIAWMLLGRNAAAAPLAAAAASTLPAPAAVPAAAAAPRDAATAPEDAAPDEIKDTPPAVPIDSRRNPFARTPPPHSVSRVSERYGEVGRDDELARSAAPPVPPMPVVPLPPMNLLPAAGRNTGAALLPGAGTKMRPVVPDTTPGNGPLQTLKLTAVVRGAQPMAIIQMTSRPQPLLVHRGDDLDGLAVVAIKDREVVFARSGRVWTLPLQAAGTEAAPGSVSVAPVDASQENTNGLP
jgi:hypothetical protein